MKIQQNADGLKNIMKTDSFWNCLIMKRNKDEEFTEVNEDMLVELAILQTGVDAEQYPYKKVTVGRVAE